MKICNYFLVEIYSTTTKYVVDTMWYYYVVDTILTHSITYRELPEYYDEITTPMCLNKIRRKIAVSHCCFVKYINSNDNRQ